MNPKITEQHLSRPAYIYVRQSTNAQVLHHQESTTGSAYAVVHRFTERQWRHLSHLSMQSVASRRLGYQVLHGLSL
jgi:hypothetical protein